MTARPLPASAPAVEAWRLALFGQFLLVFAAVALSGPGRIDIVDGQTRYEVACSLHDHGDVVIRDDYAWFGTHPGRDGQLYSSYRLPQSLLGVVAIELADRTGPVTETRRQFFFTLVPAVICALLALTYSVWFRGLGYSMQASLLWGLGGIFCTPSWYYGTSTFDDILGAQAVVLAVVVAYHSAARWPRLGAAVAGLLLAWAIHCKEPLGLFVLPVLAASAGKRQWPSAGQAAWILGLLAAGGFAYWAFDRWRFPGGVPARDAQTWTLNPLPGLLGLTASPAAGLFWYCPPFLLAVRGWFIWRTERPAFARQLMFASGLYLFFLCFLVYFKGDPCWGPRYLTPVFALGWLLVPTGAAQLSRPVVRLTSAAGVVVQLLGLSIDPQRLYLQLPIPFNYYVEAPWLGFHPAAAHLCQRPREIVEAARNIGEPGETYSPAPLPTAATTIPAPCLFSAATALGLAAGPAQPDAGQLAVALGVADQNGWREQYQAAAHRNRVFRTFRPWWISQAYLSPAPVDRALALVVLGSLGALGLLLLRPALRTRFSTGVSSLP